MHLSDWVYGLTLMQKQIEQLYYDKTAVQGLWWPHVLKIKTVAFLTPIHGQKFKMKWIFELV